MEKMMTEISNGSSPNPENPVHPVQASLPNSRKVYVPGELHPELRVPFREISLAPTKTISGEIEVNDAVRVYDTSGPWGDPAVALDVEQGLPPLRADWIRSRGDVEEIQGRTVTPIDNGYLSEAHASHAERKRPTNAGPARTVQRPMSNSEGGNGSNGNSGLGVRRSAFGVFRKPLRANPGNCVTQLAYARRGIITPEMEFIAIRENMRAGAGIGDPGRGNASHPTGITDPGYNFPPWRETRWIERSVARWVAASQREAKVGGAFVQRPRFCEAPGISTTISEGASQKRPYNIVPSSPAERPIHLHHIVTIM
jgi:hypothetical protein